MKYVRLTFALHSSSIVRVHVKSSSHKRAYAQNVKSTSEKERTGYEMLTSTEAQYIQSIMSIFKQTRCDGFHYLYSFSELGAARKKIAVFFLVQFQRIYCIIFFRKKVFKEEARVECR